MRGVAYLIVVISIYSGGFRVYGQDGDPKSSLQQRLSSQYKLTQVSKDRTDIVSAGAVLVLVKPGLMMYATDAPLPPLNTYKNGKISQGGSGFGRDIAITMLTPGGATASNYAQRKFAGGEKVWITGFGVEKSAIVFRLYSDPYDGVRYYGDLRLPFEKGSFPTPDQAMAKIVEVLTVQQADNSPSDDRLVEVSSKKLESAKPSVLLKFPSTYVSAKTPTDQLQLNADNSFSLQESGQSYHGTFVVSGNALELSINETGIKTTGNLEGNSLTDSSGQTWVLR
jgi:hypothetical protein